MAKITTGQMYNQWELMNQKLDALDQKINGIIDGSTPANTQLTGSIHEELIFWEGSLDVAAGATVEIGGEFNTPDIFEFSPSIWSSSSHDYKASIRWAGIANVSLSEEEFPNAKTQAGRHFTLEVMRLKSPRRYFFRITNNTTETRTYTKIVVQTWRRA